MNPSPRCTPVETRRDQRAFLQLEREIYQNDPNWVPPLWMIRKELVGFKHHPFYDDAEAQTFLVRRGARVVGRIAAIVNHVHNRTHREQRGFFGFYECHDDLDASHELFATACDWLRQRGMTDVRGPANPSTNYDWGLLIDGFDSPPTYMITYNRPYYARLIEAFGFQKIQDMYSYEAHIDLLKTVDPKLQFVVDEATRRFNVKCRALDRTRFNEDIRSFLRIYNQALQQTWGYVPLSEAEVEELASGLKHLIVPRLTSIAEIDGKPVGVGFGLLDYNQIIKKINGKLLPFGFLKLLTQKRKIDRLRLISTNVLPEYQKWGLGLVTLNRILPDAIDFGIQIGEFSWVLESNRLSRGTIERGGAKLTKTHRIYDLPLSNPSTAIPDPSQPAKIE
jgi:GNAT superfamily N-acetyltransferase